MPYELYEGLDNAGDLLKELSLAAKKDSDGGVTITLSELVSILAKIGVLVVGDISDDD